MKENIMKPTQIGFEKLLNKVANTKKSDIDKAKKEREGKKDDAKHTKK